MILVRCLLPHGKKLEHHVCPEGGLSFTTRRPLAVFEHMTAAELKRHCWAAKSRCSPHEPRTPAPASASPQPQTPRQLTPRRHFLPRPQR